MTVENRPAGWLGLVSISGGVGWLIRFAQFLNGDGFSTYEHVFISLGDGTVLEAAPGGSRIVSLSKYDNAGVLWCDAICADLTPEQIVLAGTPAFYMQYKNIPYSFLDYFALVAHRLHFPVPGLRERLKQLGHEICSQLGDAFHIGLKHFIFLDDRWTGYVTPGMLWKKELELRAENKNGRA